MSELHDHARRWLEEHGDPFGDEPYTTSGNPWLWEAERAFGEELMAWRDANTPPPVPLPPAAGFHLYRLWASDGRLLYVGVSTVLRQRLKAHERRWGDLIASVTWEEHADERAMLDAEREAIRDEHPALNKAAVG